MPKTSGIPSRNRLCQYPQGYIFYYEYIPLGVSLSTSEVGGGWEHAMEAVDLPSPRQMHERMLSPGLTHTLVTECFVPRIYLIATVMKM